MIRVGCRCVFSKFVFSRGNFYLERVTTNLLNIMFSFTVSGWFIHIILIYVVSEAFISTERLYVTAGVILFSRTNYDD